MNQITVPIQNNQKTNTASSLQIIGQDMHIMNPELFKTIEQQDSKSLAAMAEKQVAAGADALDLNLGPAKKNNNQLTWAVQIIQEAVHVPLFISSHALTRPEVLKTHQGTATINSVTADPATLAADMKRTREYGADLVVLLTQPGLTPFTVDERLHLAMKVLETAEQQGFPYSSLYLDPLFHLRPDPMTWQLSRGIPDIDSVLETIEMLPQLSNEKVRTVVALSSASQFLPASERATLHHRLLPMLVEVGLDAVILNCHDRRLMEIAHHLRSSSKNILSPVQQAEAHLDKVV